MRHGEFVSIEDRALVCRYCLKLQYQDGTSKSIRCENCGRTIFRRQSNLLARAGYDIAQFGWSYYIFYDGKEAEARRKARLAEPSDLLWVLGTWAVQTIAAGVGYDLFREGARRLYQHFKKTRGTKHKEVPDASVLRIGYKSLRRLAKEHLKVNQRAATSVAQIRASGLLPNGILLKADRNSVTIEVSYRRMKPRRTVDPRPKMDSSPAQLRPSQLFRG